LSTGPSADELEVSVFGGGYGECICVHLGDARWMIVDSCREPTSMQPAALNYLDSIGVDVATAVQLIVVTHWDDDHIRGIAKVVERCGSAKVAISAALGKREVISIISEQSKLASATGSGVDELRKIYELRRNSNSLVLTKSNVLLYSVLSGRPPSVIALSPSDDACLRSIETLIEQSTSAKISVSRRFKAPENPNGASIATFIDCFGSQVLLGADLEISPNELAGWNAVVETANPNSKASLVKVPHHGSITGHDPIMWSELVVDDSLAIISPWVRGGRLLPEGSDLTRIKSLASRVYLTAKPTAHQIRRNPEIAGQIRRTHGRSLTVMRGWGQVRARKSEIEADWRVELIGSALLVA
jgi:beta-lactamase superfamily II metal-dependent hydrolase